MNNYFKVVSDDLTSVGLLGAAKLQYKVGEWVYPLEPLSDHPRRGGGLWVIRKRGAAFRMRRYLLDNHNLRARVFSCRIGDIILETSYRLKTDKVMLLDELYEN